MNNNNLNIAFYFHGLSIDRTKYWKEVFLELVSEYNINIYIVFAKNTDLIHFQTQLNNTNIKCIYEKEYREDILTSDSLLKYSNKYSKYNFGKILLMDTYNTVIYSTIINTFISLLSFYEKLIHENNIRLFFIMEPRSIPYTINTYAIELVSNELKIKFLYNHNAAGWLNSASFNNLSRINNNIINQYNIKRTNISKIEINTVSEFANKYLEFKNNNITQDYINGRGNWEKSNFNKIISSFKNILGKSKYSEKTLDICNNSKYVLFLPSKPTNRAKYMSPYYYNSDIIAEWLSISIPVDYKLLIKEHPRHQKRLNNIYKSKLKNNNIPDNCIYIYDNINTFELIKNATVVVTISSSVIFDLLLQYKKILTFGENPYFIGTCESIPVKKCTNPESLPKIINELIQMPNNKNDIDSFIYSVLVNTIPWGYGENYEWENVEFKHFFGNSDNLLKNVATNMKNSILSTINDELIT